MIDPKKCPDEFTSAMHETMKVSEGIERLHRIKCVLILTSPGDPDFDRWCESYQVKPSEARLEYFRQQQLARKRKEQGLE